MPTFTRDSKAYSPDGTEVDAGVARFEDGKFDKAVLVEEGTTNLLADGNCENNAPTLNAYRFASANIASLSLSSEWAHEGSKSMKIVIGSSGAADNYVQFGNHTLNGLTPGQTYTFSAYVYIPADVNPHNVR